MGAKNLRQRIGTQQSGMIFVVAFATLVGGFFRCWRVMQSDFPLNDGGLFMQMTRDLLANHGRIPFSTTYNFAQIPFAYPPLSFYIIGIIQNLSGLSLIKIFQFFPLIFSILSIPAFYWLCISILDHQAQATYATLAYALVLPAYEWLVSGGGVTRAPGNFFCILTLAQAIRVLKSGQLRGIWIEIILGSLTLLFHLEMFWLVTISVAYFACVYQRNHRGLWHLLGYGAGVTLLTAPYWLTVMLQHGFDPFLNAFTHGEYNLAVTIAKLLAFNFTEENLISILAVLALLGWFSLFAQRKFGLFGWFLLLIVLDPRSANRTAVLPLMMAAGVAVNAVLLPGFNSLRQNISGPQGDEPQVSGSLSADLNSSTGKSVLISLFLITFISTCMSGFLSQPGLTALSVDNRQAMAWIGQNTPKEAQFFVLPASQSWFTDQVSEWFPSLANRKSITTVQGLEWLPKSVQAEKIKLYAEIFRCQPPYMTCIQTIDQPTIGTFDYIYVSLQGNENQTSVFDTSVAFELQLDARYKLVYKNSSVEIFEKSYLD